MGLTNEQIAQLRESLAKLTTEELIELNVTLKEKLGLMEQDARDERVKIMQDFLHPGKPAEPDEPDEPDDPDGDTYLQRLKKRIQYM